MVIKKQENIDSFVKLLGNFGRWQLLVFGTVSIVKLTTAWVQMSMLFLTPSVLFRCASLPNATKEIANSTCYAECQEYEYDTSPFDNTIVSEWGLVCERGWLTSFTQTMLQLGILVGSVISGFFSDRYGRKNTFLSAIVMMIAFGLTVPFSSNYATFTALRFLLGVATAGTMGVAFVIVMESVGPKYRETVGCLYCIPFIIAYSQAYVAGHATLPVLAYYYRSWDTYCLAMAVPTLIYLCYFFILTESPRWLVSVGRVEEAAKIVERAAIMNKMPTSTIRETLTQLSQDIKSNSSGAKYNYSDLFRVPLRLRTLCCCIIWLVAGVSYFGFNQYISQTSPNPFLSTAVAAALQIPSVLLSIYLMKKIGRRLTTTIFFILGGVFIVTLTFVPDTFSVTLALGTLGVSCSSIVASTLYIYTSELYPTVIRNMGLAVCSTFMRAGSMVAPFVSNTSLVVPWLPAVIFGVAPMGAGLICLLLPETKGSNLPDSIREVSGSN